MLKSLHLPLQIPFHPPPPYAQSLEKCTTWPSLPSGFSLRQATRSHQQGTYAPGPFLLDLGLAVSLFLHLRPQAHQEAPPTP